MVQAALLRQAGNSDGTGGLVLFRLVARLNVSRVIELWFEVELTG